MTEEDKKIFVCMSGGVDSSVAAALLVHDGYDVTGAFMVNYDNGESCWRNDYRDALRVAAKLGIPLLKLDFTKDYKEQVLDHMFAEYKKGRTPNPDVLCNKLIKFGAWIEKARELGFDAIATGHYASIKILKHKNIKTYHLIQAKDGNKDQTYFLHQLNQEQLAHTLFPLGDYTKDEVRSLAREFELPTAEKEESMGICFVGEVPMKEFLQERIEKKQGNIVTSSGDVVGKHDGLAFYTIGQRHLGIQNSKFKKQMASRSTWSVRIVRRMNSLLGLKMAQCFGPRK
ncbi:MAG: tRNA 2-thiouridine(34) synthase MnmA [Candidatus Magasanikbacteria bacterium]